MPHDSTYQRILGKAVDVEELERLGNAYLNKKKYFGRLVLVAIDGRINTLVGPSGSGKTTLLSLMAGLDKPTQGSIYI